jgi:hypothetical protein
MAGMTHVKAKHVRPFLNQLLQRFCFLRSRAKRADDFRFTHG